MFDYDSPCQFENCVATARGEDSFCYVCKRYLCRPHYDRKRHWCRYQGKCAWYQEWQTLADLDLERLKKEIATIRPGSAFVVDVSNGDVSDRTDMGENIHLPVKFETGEEWLLRIPTFAVIPEPATIAAKINTSEVLTYKALRAAGVSVPEVHGWGLGIVSKTSDPRFTHILYEKLAGSPVHDLNALSPEQIDLLINTYAAQAIKVSAIKSEAIGGLCTNNSNETVIGKSVDIRNSNGPHSDDLGGPFHSTLEKYLHQIDAILSAIKANMMFRGAPLFAYLSYLEVRELILACPALKEEEQEFYLKHPDPKSDNLLISSSGAVTALLDWQWAETTCKTAAFGAPRWALSQAFWDGDMALSELEVKLFEAYESHGRQDLAHCVKNARVYQLLDSYLGTDFYTYEDNLRRYFLEHFHAMQRTLDPSCTLDTSTSIPPWISQMTKKHEGDEGLAAIKELDRQSSKARMHSRVIYPLKHLITKWMK